MILSFSMGVHRIMTYLSRLLIWLEAILRLRINLDKSELLLMERVENLDDFTLEFSCKVGFLPSSYLGAHLNP